PGRGSAGPAASSETDECGKAHDSSSFIRCVHHLRPARTGHGRAAESERSTTFRLTSRCVPAATAAAMLAKPTWDSSTVSPAYSEMRQRHSGYRGLEIAVTCIAVSSDASIPG